MSSALNIVNQSADFEHDLFTVSKTAGWNPEDWKKLEGNPKLLRAILRFIQKWQDIEQKIGDIKQVDLPQADPDQFISPGNNSQLSLTKSMNELLKGVEQIPLMPGFRIEYVDTLDKLNAKDVVDVFEEGVPTSFKSAAQFYWALHLLLIERANINHTSVLRENTDNMFFMQHPLKPEAMLSVNVSRHETLDTWSINSRVVASDTFLRKGVRLFRLARVSSF